MGRRTNYGFEKRQKEIKRQKKKEKKLEERRARKQAGEGNGEGAVEGSEAIDGADEETGESREQREN